MFYSNKHNLLVIAIPKTGTVSVQNALLEHLDSEGQTHGIIIDDVTYESSSFYQGTIGHARAKEFKAVLGDDQYNKLVTIAFIRNPYAKLVSAYHYTKSNSIFMRHKGKKKKLSRTISYTLGVLTAKLLPFSLWIFIYPYRSSSCYIENESGECIVDYVGATENLEADLNKFLKESNILKEGDMVRLQRLNTSKHYEYKEYYKSILTQKIAYRKMKCDIMDYENRFGKIQLL